MNQNNGWGSPPPPGPPPYGAPPTGDPRWPPQQAPGGYGAPPPKKKEPATMAWIALGLGIASWVFGTSLMTAVPGVILARMEMKNIREGRTSPDNNTLVQAAFWLSLSHIIVAVLALLAFGCIFGGAFLIPIITRLNGG